MVKHCVTSDSYAGRGMQVQTIAEQLFFTTVRIDTVTANGGQGSGTGFFFTHEIGDQEYPFVVTNKHAVMGMREGALSFLQRKDMLPTGSRRISLLTQ